MYGSTYETLLLYIAILTILVQIYVIWLIYRKSPFTMQEYRLFLNLFIICDMIFTIWLGIFLEPDSVPNLLCAWPRGLSSYISPYASLYTLGFVIFAGANAVLIQNYCLLYRYTIIHDNKNIHAIFMSTKCKLLFFIVYQSISVMLGVLMYFSCVTPEELPKRISALAPEFLKILDPNEFIFWIDVEKRITIYFMFIMLLLFVIVESSCITLVYLILSTLKQKAGLFSRTTYRLHFQLTTLLTIQLLTPFLFIILPVALCLVFAFMGQFSSQVVGRVGFFFITLYGLVNAICTIIFITPYRMHAYLKLVQICPPIDLIFKEKRQRRGMASDVQSIQWVTKT